MSNVDSVVHSGANTSLKGIETLRGQLRGQIILPGDPDYEEARRVYNAMIDKRPAVIARCADVADVISAVNFGREQKLDVAVRGGSHNGPGFGVVDDGLVIDLSRMHGVRVDPSNNTVRVEGGALWGDVDHATHPFGLAVPSGFLSTTGVGGLTLGGGIGYLTRHYGLTIDNLLSVDMVLADGRFVTASAEQNADLFWAVRGGGGNFGVVTSFLFKGSPIHTVYGGPCSGRWKWPPISCIIWQELILSDPDDLNGWFGFVTVPPAAPFPEEYQMQEDVRRGLVLYRPAGESRRGFQAHPRIPPTCHRFCRADPLPGAANHVRRPVPGRFAVVLARRFLQSASTIRRSTCTSSMASQLPTPHSTMHIYPINGAAGELASRTLPGRTARRELRPGHRRRRPRPGQQRAHDRMGQRLLAWRSIHIRRAART